jgi:hypothetical protein
MQSTLACSTGCILAGGAVKRTASANAAHAVKDAANVAPGVHLLLSTATVSYVVVAIAVAMRDYGNDIPMTVNSLLKPLSRRLFISADMSVFSRCLHAKIIAAVW